MLGFIQMLSSKDVQLVISICLLLVSGASLGAHIAGQRGYAPWIGCLAGTSCVSALLFPSILKDLNDIEGDEKRAAARRSGHFLMLIVGSICWNLIVFVIGLFK